MRIRRAAPADAEGIARLHYRSHTTSFAAFAPAAWVSSRDLDAYRQVWRERLNGDGLDATTWVAEENAGIIGIVGVCRASVEADYGHPGSAAIRAFHVHPQRVGQGIGRRLWANAHSSLRARGCVRASVDTIAANARARRFFEAAACRLMRIVPRGIEGVPIAIYALDLSAALADDASAEPAP